MVFPSDHHILIVDSVW